MPDLPRHESGVGLNHRSHGQDTIFRHDNNSVSNVVSGSIEVLDALFVDDSDVFADMCVLIDNRAPDD